MKLTEEQCLIVEENHNLIYSYIHKNYLDLEEWYGLLAIELCKAVKVWDKEKGTLSTIFYYMCDNRVKHEYRRTQAKKRQHEGMLSLDYTYIDNSGNQKTLEELAQFGVEPEYEGEMYNGELLEEMLQDEHGEIIRLSYLGYNQAEIGEMIDLSQSQVSRILKKMRNKYFGGED